MSANRVKNLVAAIVVVAYLMAPADLANDAIPVLGQIDDAVVALIGLLAAMRQISGKGGDGDRGGQGK